MKKKIRQLALHKETVRLLNSSALRDPMGAGDTWHASNCGNCQSQNGCVTLTCYICSTPEYGCCSHVHTEE